MNKELENSSLKFAETKNVEVTHVYGREEAQHVIELASADYDAKYGNVNESLVEAILDAVAVK